MQCMEGYENRRYSLLCIKWWTHFTPLVKDVYFISSSIDFVLFSLDFTLQQRLLVAGPLVSETLGAVSILLPFIFQIWAWRSRQFARSRQQSLMHPLGSSKITSFFKGNNFYPLSSWCPIYARWPMYLSPSTQYLWLLGCIFKLKGERSTPSSSIEPLWTLSKNHELFKNGFLSNQLYPSRGFKISWFQCNFGDSNIP